MTFLEWGSCKGLDSYILQTQYVRILHIFLCSRIPLVPLHVREIVIIFNIRGGMAVYGTELRTEKTRRETPGGGGILV